MTAKGNLPAAMMLVGYFENWGILGKKSLREISRQPGKKNDDSFRKDCALIQSVELEQMIIGLKGY